VERNAGLSSVFFPLSYYFLHHNKAAVPHVFLGFILLHKSEQEQNLTAGQCTSSNESNSREIMTSPGLPALRRRYNVSTPKRSPLDETSNQARTRPGVTGIASFICLAIELDVYLFSEPITSYVDPARSGEGGSFSVSRFGLQYDDVGFGDEEAYEDGTSRFGASLVRGDKMVIKHVNASSADDGNPSSVAGDDGPVLQPLTTEMRILQHPPLRDHKNVVKLIGVAFEPRLDFENRCWPMLVLEYAHCGNLQDFFSLPHRWVEFDQWELKQNLGLDVLLGLSALHRFGVAHGDLKPGNVLVAVDNNKGFVAKISDFGFSIIEMDHVFPAPLPGFTPHWAAPEAGAGSFDWGAMCLMDLYSFGLVFAYIILSGTSPLSRAVSSELRVRNPPPPFFFSLSGA